MDQRNANAAYELHQLRAILSFHYYKGSSDAAPNYSRFEQVLTLLADMPPRIAELTSGLTPNQLHAPLVPTSGLLMMCLPISERVPNIWGDGMAAIIARETPTFRGLSIPALGSGRQTISNRTVPTENSIR